MFRSRRTATRRQKKGKKRKYKETENGTRQGYILSVSTPDYPCPNGYNGHMVNRNNTPSPQEVNFFPMSTEFITQKDALFPVFLLQFSPFFSLFTPPCIEFCVIYTPGTRRRENQTITAGFQLQCIYEPVQNHETFMVVSYGLNIMDRLQYSVCGVFHS